MRSIALTNSCQVLACVAFASLPQNAVQVEPCNHDRPAARLREVGNVDSDCAGKRPPWGACQVVRAAAIAASTDAPATAFSSPSKETSNMYKKLQNGSDVRGIAITGNAEVDMLMV